MSECKEILNVGPCEQADREPIYKNWFDEGIITMTQYFRIIRMDRCGHYVYYDWMTEQVRVELILK